MLTQAADASLDAVQAEVTMREPFSNTTGHGHYLTDGIRLYRHLTPTRGPLGGALVGLENCRSLELVLMPVGEYARLRDVFRWGPKAAGAHASGRSKATARQPGSVAAR
jgi:hypothetical protein